MEPHDLIPDDVLADLGPRHTKFACAIATGKTGKDAAVEAGYAPKYAKVRASRLLKDPRISRAIDAIRQRGVEEAKYDLVRLIRTFEADRDFARANKNPMAAVKASENLGRLSGFLDHRIEVNVSYVDVAGALAEAKARALRPTVNDAETVDFVEVGAHGHDGR